MSVEMKIKNCVNEIISLKSHFVYQTQTCPLV